MECKIDQSGLALQLFQNTAAALPAELGPDGTYERRQKRRQFRMLNPTRAALAWHKRVTAQKQRTEVGILQDMHAVSGV